MGEGRRSNVALIDGFQRNKKDGMQIDAVAYFVGCGYDMRTSAFPGFFNIKVCK